MPTRLSRRKLLQAGVAAGAGLAAPSIAKAAETALNVRLQGAVKPVVISSGNGNVFKNGGSQTCVEKAFQMMTSGGADVLDALIAGVNILELDPEEISIGYGGLPNADGVVQLDSCCMHGPKRWAGGVAALEGVRTPSLVAKAVADQTDHHLLVGKGAQQFARGLGFKVEDDLNTEKSRAIWMDWKRRTDKEHYLDPKQREEIGHQAALAMIDEGIIDPLHYYGTINCNGINSKGDLCGVTTTSGLAFKIPGRVGDSPILGAGLYVDNGVGAAGSTGRGEANLFNLCSFLIVEELRRGAHPKDAALAAMKRVQHNTVEKRLLDGRRRFNFGLEFYVLDTKGNHAGISTNQGSRYAVCDDGGPRFVPCEPFLG